MVQQTINRFSTILPDLTIYRMNDLTKSTIDRQNVLNNKQAVERLQEYLGLTGMLFNEEYRFTLQQITDF